MYRLAPVGAQLRYSKSTVYSLRTETVAECPKPNLYAVILSFPSLISEYGWDIVHLHLGQLRLLRLAVIIWNIVGKEGGNIDCKLKFGYFLLNLDWLVQTSSF